MRHSWVLKSLRFGVALMAGNVCLGHKKASVRARLGCRWRRRVQVLREGRPPAPARAEAGEGRGSAPEDGDTKPRDAPSTQSSLGVSTNALGAFAAVVTLVVYTSTALYWTYVTNAKLSNIEEKVNRADVALFGVRAGVPDLEGKVSKEPTPGLIEQVEQIKRTQREMQQAQQEMRQTQQEILQRLPPAKPNRQ